ncbi:MAG: ribosome silencing factor [bacterium]|nr:MAG: ribosome silencing factor [bacterium]
MNSEQLSHFIAELTLEKKAEDVLVMNLRELTSITDYFVICSGDSDIQVKAICDHITETLTQENIKIWHVEGYQALNWVLMDLVDVVIHIFRPEVREFYALEKLWGDAKVTKVEDQ